MFDAPSNIGAGMRVRVKSINHLQERFPVFRGDFGDVIETSLDKANPWRHLAMVKIGTLQAIPFFFHQLEEVI